MTAWRHLELLVEEPSMEAFLNALLPRLLPADCTYSVHTFQGKKDLLRKLPSRLSAYRAWITSNYRIIVIVDRDSDDCHELKARLERTAATSGLLTRTEAAAGQPWEVINRIVIEELEAWYFGDWEAVRGAYPRVRPSTIRQASYRDPDAILGGTWEAFERIMRRHGYFKTGLRKIEVAKAVATHIDPNCNSSRSFVNFRQAIMEAIL